MINVLSISNLVSSVLETGEKLTVSDHNNIKQLRQAFDEYFIDPYPFKLKPKSDSDRYILYYIILHISKLYL